MSQDQTGSNRIKQDFWWHFLDKTISNSPYKFLWAPLDGKQERFMNFSDVHLWNYQ